MTEAPTWKVLDTRSGAAMFYGTWQQCVRYAVREKLGTYNQYGWLGRVLQMRDGYDIRGG